MSEYEETQEEFPEGNFVSEAQAEWMCVQAARFNAEADHEYAFVPAWTTQSSPLSPLDADRPTLLCVNLTRDRENVDEYELAYTDEVYSGDPLANYKSKLSIRCWADDTNYQYEKVSPGPRIGIDTSLREFHQYE